MQFSSSVFGTSSIWYQYILISFIFTDLQAHFLAFVLVFAIHALAGIPDLSRRQTECSSPCSWISGLNSCADTDTTCICGVFSSAGSAAIASCESCYQTVNATLASDVSQLAHDCGITLGPTSTAKATATSTLGPTSTAKATATSTSTPVNPCSSPCSWVSGLDSCADTDTNCICGVFSSAGSAAVSGCKSCYETVNATLAADVSQIAQYCGISLVPTEVNSCSSPCSWVSGLDSCADTDTNCICRVFSSAGSAAVASCASCYQTVNATLAADVSEISQNCNSIATSTGLTTSVGLPIRTTITSGITNSTSVATVGPASNIANKIVCSPLSCPFVFQISANWRDCCWCRSGGYRGGWHPSVRLL